MTVQASGDPVPTLDVVHIGAMFHVKHCTPPALRFIDDALLEAKRGDLLRERLPPGEGATLSFCSNDYLALACRAAPAVPRGAGASRLVAGDRRIHERLEAAAASLVGQPAALAFTSGYAANVGLLSSLAGSEDIIVSDALNHASLIDGARLSRARVFVVPHLDVSAVARCLAGGGWRRAFVVTESYFSMDADSPDLKALRGICDKAGAALIVDEAHALGVFGSNGGRGLCAEAGVAADATVGTFGKAFGAAGAFVAGSDALAVWLWNRARSFVFSTGLSPAIAAAALDGIDTARAQSWRQKAVADAAARLREGLGGLGAEIRGYGHIIPWVVGESAAALDLASGLQKHGVDVCAIRPPSVPAGTARLRFTVTAAHQRADIDRAVDAARAVLATGAAGAKSEIGDGRSASLVNGPVDR